MAETTTQSTGFKRSTALQMHLMLHRCRNWSVKLMPDASGNECLHFCIPCEENGIELRARRKATIIEPDGSNVTVAGWTFKATPTWHCGNKLFALLVQIPKELYHRLVETGKINCQEKKNIHGIMGDLSPWPYGPDYKKKS